MRRNKQQTSCYEIICALRRGKTWEGGRAIFSREAKAALWAQEEMKKQWRQIGCARQGTSNRQPGVSEAAPLHVHTPLWTSIPVLQLAVQDGTAMERESGGRVQRWASASSKDPKKKVR